MTTPVDVLVAIPARNEAATINDCLERVITAGRTAQTAGSVRHFRVAVAAHRCTDRTADLVESVLRREHIDHRVLVLGQPASVGTVRTRLITEALDRDPAEAWIFSTDADSLVPADWIVATLARASEAGADLVAGLTELNDWTADPSAQRAYQDLIAAGMTADGHRHVYAANLAVHAPAFFAAGGFPDVAHGEERHLLEGVRRAGGRTIASRAPVVITSGRMPGRAAYGLGALLADLAAQQPAEGAA